MDRGGQGVGMQTRQTRPAERNAGERGRARGSGYPTTYPTRIPPERRTRQAVRHRLPRWQRALLSAGLVLGVVLIGISAGMLISQRLGMTQQVGVTSSPVSGQGAKAPFAGTPTAAHQVSGALTGCQILPQQPRMLSVQAIDHPLSPGRRLLPNGHAIGCEVANLWVPQPDGGNPNLPGRVILVNVTQEWLWAYQDGQLVFATPVTTAMPELWTPRGIFHILSKTTDTLFSSPWPPGSPYYYSPVHVDYAMYFRAVDFFIHDAPWRHYFGPGTDVPHVDPDGTQEIGSHGCVEVTYGAGQWLYQWAGVGTTIDITDI